MTIRKPLSPEELGLALPFWEVTYSLPYQHVVVVGVRAATADEATTRVQAAFDAGTLWDDNPDMPLLKDDFEEEDDGTVLSFEAEAVADWSEPDVSVLALRRQRQAEQALDLLQRLGPALDSLLDLTSRDIYTDAPEYRDTLETLGSTLAELHALATEANTLRSPA